MYIINVTLLLAITPPIRHYKWRRNAGVDNPPALPLRKFLAVNTTNFTLLGMEPKEVFISYKREQIAIDFVAVLKHELEVNGFSVWRDSDGGIEPGSYMAAEICKGVDECKTFIPVVTK